MFVVLTCMKAASLRNYPRFFENRHFLKNKSCPSRSSCLRLRLPTQDPRLRTLDQLAVNSGPAQSKLVRPSQSWSNQNFWRVKPRLPGTVRPPSGSRGILGGGIPGRRSQTRFAPGWHTLPLQGNGRGHPSPTQNRNPHPGRARCPPYVGVPPNSEPKTRNSELVQFRHRIC